MSASSRPKYSRNPAARAAFLAKREDIQKRLEKGEFMRDIFEELELPGSYTQFTRYVSSYLPQARPGATLEAKSPRARSPPAAGNGSEPDRPPDAADQPQEAPRPEDGSPRTASRRTADRPNYDPANIKRHENY